MNFLSKGREQSQRVRGKEDDATPVRLPMRAQAMQDAAIKVQNSIREKYGWQHQQQLPQHYQLHGAVPAEATTLRRQGAMQHNSLKRALGEYDQQQRSADARAPNGGSTGMAPQVANRPAASGSARHPVMKSIASGLIPRSPRLLNKNLQGQSSDARGNSLTHRQQYQNHIGANTFRHVRISSDEFNIHNPLHNGLAAGHSPYRGPNHAIQLFNHKIAMASSQVSQQQSAYSQSMVNSNHKEAGNDKMDEVRINRVRAAQQKSSSSSDDDDFTDMNEFSNTNAGNVKPRFPNHGGQYSCVAPIGQSAVQMGLSAVPIGGASAVPIGPSTAARALPMTLPQQRPVNYQPPPLRDALAHRSHVPMQPMSQQAPDSEVTASDPIDFSMIEYLRGPGGHIIANGSSTDKNAHYGMNAMRPQMLENEMAGLRKRGETESVMQEETTVHGDRMSSRNDSRLVGKITSSVLTRKDGRNSNQMDPLAMKGSSRGDATAKKSKSDANDVLVIKKSPIGAKTKAQMNKSDEIREMPTNFEYKDEMTVLEMDEAEEHGSRSSKELIKQQNQSIEPSSLQFPASKELQQEPPSASSQSSQTPIESSKSQISKNNIDSGMQDYANIPEQEVEDDDEMLNYSKFSQSRPSNVRNNLQQMVADRAESNQQFHPLRKLLSNPEVLESSKMGSDPQLGSDPYGLNDRIDSSLLDSKLEPKEHLQYMVNSQKFEKEQLNEAASDQNIKKMPTESHEVEPMEIQPKQESCQHQLYNARTSKTNKEQQLSAKDLAKSGIALSSPFVLSHDMASDIQPNEAQGTTLDFQVRPSEMKTSELMTNEQIPEQLVSPSLPPKNDMTANRYSENSKIQNSKQTSRQELSDISIIASQKSHVKPVRPLDLNAVIDIKKKCSKISKRLEVQRNLMMDRRLSNMSDDVSRTETGYKIEGNLQEQDLLNRLKISQNNVIFDGIFSKGLLSGEVSMISNFDHVKSAEWNNLKDLNDQPESSNRHSEAPNQLKNLAKAPPSTKSRQTEPIQQIEEKKVEDAPSSPEKTSPSKSSPTKASPIKSSPKQKTSQLVTQISVAPEPQQPANVPKVTKLNLDSMPLERSQVSQADYKKFVYSPREKLTLQASRMQVSQTQQVNSAAAGQDRGASSDSGRPRQQEQVILQAEQVRIVEDLIVQQPPRTKEIIEIGIVGEKGTGKTSVKKYMEGKGNRSEENGGGVFTIWFNAIQRKVRFDEIVDISAQEIAQKIQDYDGFVVLFDVSNRQSLASAGQTLSSLRQLTKVPTICLAHKFDQVIEMSDRQLADKGISEQVLANFSHEQRLKVIKTSMKLPRLLDESFMEILGQIAALRDPVEMPSRNHANQQQTLLQFSSKSLRQPTTNATPLVLSNTAVAGHPHSTAFPAPPVISNIEIRTQHTPSSKPSPSHPSTDHSPMIFLDQNGHGPSPFSPKQGSSEKRRQGVTRQIQIVLNTREDVEPRNMGPKNRDGSQARKMDIVAVNEVKRGKDAPADKPLQRKDASSVRRSSIYEQLLNQQVLKTKNGRTHLNRDSVNSLTLNVNQSIIQKNGDVSDTKSPGVVQMFGDISLENKVKQKAKVAKTGRKQNQRAVSSKPTDMLGQSIRSQDERDPLGKTHRPGMEAPATAKQTTTKKKTKRKNYKNILDTALKMNRKRNSTQTSRDKQASRNNSSSNSEAKLNLNHKRFNQMISEDIARTQERLQSRKATGRSEQNSVQKTPKLESSHSGMIKLEPTCKIDLLKEGCYNQDIDVTDNLICQDVDPKGQAQQTQQIIEAKPAVDEANLLYHEVVKSDQIKEEPKHKRGRSKYIEDAKAFVNIIEGLKQTIADGGNSNSNFNQSNTVNHTVNTSTNQRLNTKNSGGQCDEYGRPSAAGGKDTFKYFFQTENAATDQHEFESLIEQQKSSHEPLSRESKNNTIKGNQGIFNDNMMPKFGDQSSIYKDDLASTNIAMALDSAIPQGLNASPNRLQKKQPVVQDAPIFESKLRQKWKTKTTRRGKNKLTAYSSDRAAGAASSPNKDSKYSLMSENKLRSKFQDLMKQNQMKSSYVPQTQRNQSNSASNRSLPRGNELQSFTTANKILQKVSSKRSLPGTTMIGDRKFVTKYRDPSLPANAISLSQEPRPIAIPIGQGKNPQSDANMIAHQRQYLREKKDRQNKIKQRIKNIDQLEQIQYEGMIAEWPSSVSSKVSDQLSASREPTLKKEKKNFRDMFTKVKVFDFGDTKKKDKLTDNEVNVDQSETRNGGVYPQGELNKGSYVSDQIQDRYLMNCKDSGVSIGGD